VQRQVVPEHACRFLRRDLRENRNVIEEGGDVVEKAEEAGTGHGVVLSCGVAFQTGSPGDRVELQSTRALALETPFAAGLLTVYFDMFPSTLQRPGPRHAMNRKTNE